MLVVMLDSVALVNQSLKYGHTYDLSEHRAMKLIRRGLAEAAKSDKQIRRPAKRQTTSLSHGEK